jgi:hypothetical protein
MKREFLYRLVAVAIFCFSSLLIKSEMTTCKIKCKETLSKIASQRPIFKKEFNDNNVLPHDGFFIKI